MERYNKLVRDKIPEILEKQGKRYIISKCPDDAPGAMLYESYLHTKIIEELLEIKNHPTSEECADMYEAMLALFHLYGYSLSKINDVATKKRQEKGGFMQKIILREVK